MSEAGLDDTLDEVRTFRRVRRRYTLPRLGFVGVGWIGKHRLQAVAESGAARIVAVADPAVGMLEAVRGVVPDAELTHSFEDLLKLPLDGVVIATPSALHSGQAITALERGLAVFCQKPLARTASETQIIVDAARTADRLLAVDLSYRYTTAMTRIRELIDAGALGHVYAVNLVFHNAYGPDKPWFYDRALSGGGCIMDLGIHLVDLALWALGHERAVPAIDVVSSRLLARGRPVTGSLRDAVEDFAAVQMELDVDTVVQLSCSWRLAAGCDAVIEAAFYGTEGGARMRNVNGSFYDFVAEHCTGTARVPLAEPPDAWGGRAVLDWVNKLGAGMGYDEDADRLVDVAAVVDAIYARAGGDHDVL